MKLTVNIGIGQLLVNTVTINELSRFIIRHFSDVIVHDLTENKVRPFKHFLATPKISRKVNTKRLGSRLVKRFILTHKQARFSMPETINTLLYVTNHKQLASVLPFCQ